MERPTATASPVVAARQQVVQAEVRRSGLGSRMAEYSRRHGLGFTDPDTPRGRPGAIQTRGVSRPWSVHARYYDRPDLIRHDYRHTYSYYDPYYRLHHRVIWPSYYYPVCYSFGPRVYFRHVYPYYHRKYVFVSLGGWWPWDYSYVRYYWYGYHPYVWYGYYPIAREVVADNYNYYTYNYYYQNDDGGLTSYSSETPVESAARPADQSTWADVREKLDKQDGQQPAAQTLADTRFEEGVKGFESGDYGIAVRKFEEALRLSPDDMILPFAYAQALFADGRYTESAEILRKALSKTSPEKEGVFYPRGLYANDDVLYAQIENLVDKLDRFGYDADMQLLLGYHLLGVGETGYAREPLERASQDLENTGSARVLLKVLDKIESEASASDRAGEAAVKPSNVTTGSGAETKADVAPQRDATVAPAAAQPSDVPDVPVQEVPASDKIGGAAAPGQSGATDKPEPSTGGNGSGVTPIAPAGGSRLSSRGPGASADTDVALAGSPSQAIVGISRYLRADFAIFAGIVLLGWAGVYVQWRGLDGSRA